MVGKLPSCPCTSTNFLKPPLYSERHTSLVKVSKVLAVIEIVPPGDYDVYVTHPSLLIPGQVTPSMPRRVKFDASNVHVLEAKFDLVPKAEPSRRTPPATYE